MTHNQWTKESLESWLDHRISEASGIPIHEIDRTKPLASYGLDSVTVVGLSGELEELLNIRLEPTFVFEYPTIERIATYLETLLVS